MTYQEASTADALLRASLTSFDPCIVTKVEGILSGFLPTRPQVQSRNNLFAVFCARSEEDVGFLPSISVVRWQLHSSVPPYLFMRYLADGQWTD